MTCSEAYDLIILYLDHELDGRRSQALQQHLAGCAACRADFQTQAALDARVQTLQDSVPPAGIAAQVMERLARQRAATTPFAAVPARRRAEAHTSAPALPWTPGKRQAAPAPRRLSPAAPLLAGLLVVIVVATAVLAALPAFRPGAAPAATGDRLYALRSEPQGALLALDARTLQVLGETPLGAYPRGLLIGPDGRASVAAGLPGVAADEDGHPASSGVWIIDRKTLQVADIVPIGYAVWDLVAGPQRGQILLTHQPTGRYLHTPAGPAIPDAAPRRPGQLVRLDTATNKLTLLAEVGDLPRGLALAAGGRLAYIVSHDAALYDETTVAAIDVQTRVIQAILPMPGYEAIAVAADGKRVFVAAAAEPYLQVIDTATQTTQSYRMSDVQPGMAIGDIAVSPAGKRLALALSAGQGKSGALLVLDAQTLQTLLVLPAPAGAGYRAAAFSSDGSRLYGATTSGSVYTFAQPSGQQAAHIDGVGQATDLVWGR